MSNFHDVLITNIIIGERFRKAVDPQKLERLKASIVANTHEDFLGLLEPIVLDRNNNLLAGGRRLQAFIDLGRPRIPSQYLDEVDDVRRREIELEENICRDDLTWQEEAALVAEIDRLKKLKYEGQTRPAPTAASLDDRLREVREVPAWTSRDTAELVGVSSSTVSRKLALADALEVMPELADEPSENQALRKIDRRLEELERELAYRELDRAGKLSQVGQVLLGDCCELLKTLDPKSIDLVIIDPPYGVLEKGGIGRYEQHFDDDPATAMATLEKAVGEIRRVVKDDAHIYCFFGIKMWAETLKIFTDFGFNVDPIPLVWVKTTGSVVDWDYRYANYWEPILFISNKTRRLNAKIPNVFVYPSVPNSDRSNVAEKPHDLLRALINNSSNVGDLVLDCFAGSGSVAIAAKALGRRFIVMEKDNSQWNEINLRLARSSDETLEQPSVGDLLTDSDYMSSGDSERGSDD